jgi:hypothetical protein
VSVTLVVFGPSPLPIQWDQAADIAGLRVVDTGLPLDWLVDDPARLDAAAEAFADFATRSGADLVHLNTPALLSGPIPIATVGGCHSCVATWWDAVRGGALPAGFSAASLRLQRGYRACDALIAPSHAFAEATRRRHGVAPRVVANGRRTFERRPASRRTTALCSGRLWDQGKNLMPSSSRRRATSPSALAVLEAAQAGARSSSPTSPPSARSGGTRHSTPRRTIEEGFLQALRTLSADPALRAQRGAAARERAELYTDHAMVEGMLALYRDVLPHRPAGVRRVKLVYFTHSLRSCWNHGNAHFLRGVLREFALAAATR